MNRLAYRPYRTTCPLDPWTGDTFMLGLAVASAPYGSLSAVSFAPASNGASPRVIRRVFDEGQLGTFAR